MKLRWFASQLRVKEQKFCSSSGIPSTRKVSRPCHPGGNDLLLYETQDRGTMQPSGWGCPELPFAPTENSRSGHRWYSPLGIVCRSFMGADNKSFSVRVPRLCDGPRSEKQRMLKSAALLVNRRRGPARLWRYIFIHYFFFLVHYCSKAIIKKVSKTGNVTFVGDGGLFPRRDS